MAIEGFDYKGFAESMSEQAKELVPKDLQPNEQEYIVNTLGNFTMLAGEAIYNDESLNITAEQAIFITQIIAEWSFHKSIDLIHSGIDRQFWDSIMQKIAFTIFEVAKQGVIREVAQDQLLQAVEHHVVKVYKKCIEDLEKRGMINETVKEQAENQSNIDEMARQAAEEQIRQKEAPLEEADNRRKEIQKRREEVRKQRKLEKEMEATAGCVTKRQMKLMALAMLLKIMPRDKANTIIKNFDGNDKKLLNHYMGIANLESLLDGDILLTCLREMKDSLPIKRTLSTDTIMRDLLRLYKSNTRDKIEKIIKNERPLVKRFISQAYDGEYSGLPLKVAGIVAQYVEDSI